LHTKNLQISKKILQGATPVAINEVVTTIIEGEKRFLPGPQIGVKIPINTKRYKKEKVSDPPGLRVRRGSVIRRRRSVIRRV
jgi:hypothetical protein